MDANKINLLEFIGSNKRTFNIPVYQRNYDWKRENCIKLFKDIENIALNNFEIDHFLGTVVYVQSRSKPNFNEYVLIDGQQRITSITLLLKALYDVIENQKTKADIYLSYLINPMETENFRIKLKPVKADRRIYEDIIDNKECYSDSNVYKNYMLFKKAIEDSPVSPENLYMAMSNIEIVYIQLEKGKKSENPQLIFESLNSTGIALTQADLIRNFLLMNHSYDEQKRLYQDYWLKIEELITNSKISDFIRHYLTMKTGETPNINDVYEAFKKFSRNNRDRFDEEGLLEDLYIFAGYYSQFLRLTSKNEKINDCLRQFHDLDSTTVYPLLMSIFDDCYQYKKLNELQLIDTMNVLISYIYRRAVCGYATNTLKSTFSNLISEIDESLEEEYADKILSSLSKQINSSVFPRNEEFEAQFPQFEFYKNNRKSSLTKYTLAMISNFGKEKINITDNITIEHIMPQTLNPQWQIDLGNRYDEIHSQYLNTIGNLTLSGYNPELSNSSFRDKKAIYKDSNISITRDICNYDIWNEESIKARAKELFSVALKIWSLPEKYNKTVSNNREINYSAVYNINDDIKVTGEKPKQIIILDYKYNISSWKEFLRILCDKLFELDNTILYNFISDQDFVGRNRHIISNSLDGMIAPYRIADNLYIETNLSALNILNYCRIICEKYHCSEDVFFMLNKNK